LINVNVHLQGENKMEDFLMKHVLLSVTMPDTIEIDDIVRIEHPEIVVKEVDKEAILNQAVRSGMESANLVNQLVTMLLSLDNE